MSEAFIVALSAEGPAARLLERARLPHGAAPGLWIVEGLAGDSPEQLIPVIRLAPTTLPSPAAFALAAQAIRAGDVDLAGAQAGGETALLASTAAVGRWNLAPVARVAAVAVGQGSPQTRAETLTLTTRRALRKAGLEEDCALVYLVNDSAVLTGWQAALGWPPDQAAPWDGGASWGAGLRALPARRAGAVVIAALHADGAAWVSVLEQV